ncbi:MAG: hypothetical protein IT158_27910 [Bryobacterales bacterium]|nr:hypothetical protein [Bryobacterales bacterium]
MSAAVMAGPLSRAQEHSAVREPGRLRARLAFLAFALAVTLGFFWEGRQADFSQISGDQVNILTICVKKDHPELLKGDAIAGDPRSTAYYTPLFVDLVRLLSRPGHEYLRGLNILLAVTSLIYMAGWYALFESWAGPWLAGVLSFFSRGILWPPGNELWGVAGLWTMVPRTLFLALLPWVLWLWIRHRGSWRGWPAAALGAGLLVNVHPLSGACVIAALAAAEMAWALSDGAGWRRAARRSVAGLVLMLAGMSPYLWTYFSGLGDASSVDSASLQQALSMRMPGFLLDPLRYLKMWFRLKWLVLLLGPWLGCVLLRRRLRRHRGMLAALAVFSASCMAVAGMAHGVEALLGRLGVEVHFAFQLVRAGKYVLAPSLIVLSLCVAAASTWLSRRFPWGRTAVIALSGIVLVLTLFARQPVFRGVPVLGDDVARFLWPAWVPPRPLNVWFGQNMEPVLAWIRGNTDVDAKFAGPGLIRVGAMRSVIHDWVGAGMLVEGNPRAFVEAARRQAMLRSGTAGDPWFAKRLFESWGADYWVTPAVLPGENPVFSSRGWNVYRLYPGAKL